VRPPHPSALVAGVPVGATHVAAVPGAPAVCVRAFIRLFWVNGAMHYSGPRGRLRSVRAVKPPPPTDKPYYAVRRSIVHTSRRSALALKPSRGGLSRRLELGPSPNQLPTSLCTSHRIGMPPGSSTNDDETQGYLSGAATATKAFPALQFRTQAAAALPQTRRSPGADVVLALYLPIRCHTSDQIEQTTPTDSFAMPLTMR
jgi:hypothetical protein